MKIVLTSERELSKGFPEELAILMTRDIWETKDAFSTVTLLDDENEIIVEYTEN